MISDLENRYREILKKVGIARLQSLNKSEDKSEDKSDVTLIAVSKTQSVEKIEALYRMGQRDFGENYVQELLEKNTELLNRGCSEIRWHFIGHLQTNKAKQLIKSVNCIHTVDSKKLATELARCWESIGNGGRLPVFIQINIDSEPTKSGLLPQVAREEILNLGKILSLDIRGLMVIPAALGDSRIAFCKLRELERTCRPTTQGKLSMGMSQDYEIAIQEGATHVRVGTALFGER